MKVSVTGQVLEVREYVKDKDGNKTVSDDVLLFQPGEKENVKVRVKRGAMEKLPEVGRQATFTGNLFVWKTRDGVGSMVGVD